MRNTLIAMCAALGLTACAQTGTAPTVASVQSQLATINAVACAIDGQQQPIIAALATPVATAINPAAGVSTAGIVALDNTALHPAVVAACAAAGGVAVGVPATAVVAPPASATSTAK